MWRSLFLALGCTACLLGGECLILDRAILRAREEAPQGFGSMGEPGRRREITPPEWAPWSLLSAGAVTMLYSFTVPNRVRGTVT